MMKNFTPALAEKMNQPGLSETRRGDFLRSAFAERLSPGASVNLMPRFFASWTIPLTNGYAGLFLPIFPAVISETVGWEQPIASAISDCVMPSC